MNTANLQLEGVYVALSALVSALRQKGLLSGQEVEDVLTRAEENIANDPKRPPQLSDSHVDAICFPLRYLKIANSAEDEGRSLSFSEVAQLIGRTKSEG